MDIFGLSFEHTLFVLALILIAIDFFLPTDVPTHIAYVLLAYLIGVNTPVPGLYQLLVGIIAWGLVVTLHYTLWRGFTRRVAHELIAPSRYKTGMSGWVGKTGILRDVDGRRLVEVYGELYPCNEQGSIEPDATVRIVQARDGRLTVTPEE